MKKFFKITGIINFLLIIILAFIFLKARESNGYLYLRKAPIVIFFVNLFSFTIISTIMLNIFIRKKLNNMIIESNNIIFKIAKYVITLITILILTFGLFIEFFIFAFSGGGSTEYTMKINDRKIIAVYDSFYYGTDPQFYYSINPFYMTPANISDNEYNKLRNKFKEAYIY
ncbi:hypothetical protein BH721_00945 [Clostridium baratii]|uniref:hypothetical protein n=1 Tax=Clostridium baratii TaxID=1561 RepID=UPI0009A3565E|nr:hypothetical protein [Clostridium baratii]OPF51621.1 hypothetical protein A1M12_03530 [Clostridium baratii]OPF55307.1 hypothetical protein BH721_00945 [Clostridium baratii]OPF57590.1 hypothetical protein BH724_08200 [Clostridium baratii]OPF60312.1 hypothetical protein BH725_06980 [Clostridium baratii]